MGGQSPLLSTLPYFADKPGLIACLAQANIDTLELLTTAIFRWQKGNVEDPITNPTVLREGIGLYLRGDMAAHLTRSVKVSRAMSMTKSYLDQIADNPASIVPLRPAAKRKPPLILPTNRRDRN